MARLAQRLSSTLRAPAFRRVCQCPNTFAPGLVLILTACLLPAAPRALPQTPPETWPGADLFLDGPVCRLRIEIERHELDQLRTDARAFVRASVQDSSAVYSNVAVHLKGSVGSFRPLDDKPSLTLDFARFGPGSRFHGLRRIHLNNSVEDPTYCNEQLGSELFRRAGIPAPRVGRAVVTLNGRKLGLYVLKEGFTEDFLSCYFKNVSGNLFEPAEGHDVNQRLKRVSLPEPALGRAQLKALARAALEADAGRRWQRLQPLLDVDEFIRFMALEIMLCHRDGYCLARNNFKLYQDFDSRRLVFLPQGMDQLFRPVELPWQPHMAGLVARAVFEAPEGNALYSREFNDLFRTLFRPEILTNRITQILGNLQDSVEPAEFKKIQLEAAALQQIISQRHRWLAEQLAHADVHPLQFKDGTAPLSGWTEADRPPDGQMDILAGPGGVLSLHLQTRSAGFPSWRTKVRLPPGRYRFEAKVSVSNVTPLSFGAHQGAGVRIAGQPRQSVDMVGTSSWRSLSCEFEVAEGVEETEFICELRASSGEAWFACNSLQVAEDR